MQSNSPPAQSRRLHRPGAWRIAALAVGLQTSWLILTGAAQTVTLHLEEFLEVAGASERSLQLLLDAWVLLPVVAVGAATLNFLRRRGPEDAARRARWLVALFTAVAALAFLAHRDFLLHRLGAVREGVLYRSAQLSRSTLAAVLDDLDVRTLVVLRDSPEILEREREIAKAEGVRFVHIPMQDAARGTRAFIELMRDSDHHPVLAHCRYGVARTGLAAAVYRMEMESWDNRRALSEARRYGGYDTLEPGSEVRQFILQYGAAATAGRLP